MIVISEASSHQTSIAKRPNVAASEVPKRDDDRQADEGHHAGLAFRQFAPCPADENQSAIDEDQRPENRRD
jgi:hypothetical protein